MHKVYEPQIRTRPGTAAHFCDIGFKGPSVMYFDWCEERPALFVRRPRPCPTRPAHAAEQRGEVGVAFRMRQSCWYDQVMRTNEGLITWTCFDERPQQAPPHQRATFIYSEMRPPRTPPRRRYVYRGTSPIRKRTPLGPYRRPMPRVVGWT